MLTSLAISAALLTAPPAAVTRPVDHVARVTDQANVTISAWSREFCGRDRAPDTWHCVIGYTMSDGTLVRVSYEIGRLLVRHRHNGHWTGPWKPSKRRFGVGGFTMLPSRAGFGS